MSRRPYIGRFAPSPSGPLHQGSLVAALASYLDARAHGGQWLLRMEDLDTPRVVPGAADRICQQLQGFGLHWDGPILVQSARNAVYREAFDRLTHAGHIYGCGCTRKEIADSVLRRDGRLPDGEIPYPGTCAQGLPPGRHARAWRVRVPPGVIHFEDRWVGPQQQDVAADVGDFVLLRADGLWAYQLAVVVDDAAQHVTDVVRGADLLASTPRQRVLQRLLGLPEPRMMHVPVVTNADGQKLSKQTGATALDPARALDGLREAGHHLELGDIVRTEVAGWLTEATRVWAARWVDGA
ncbi:tRNA glutamyl-Q(34) synthetase GluQRS [Pigmentiphaga litoralis]|uniref:Glutamyl-Q tRNA(Asp) synthetase n=1 Tax=Pigmentiphaga litoralis TaxID=516702 RepID=A0A7Y9IVA1_9BURK|nr:tRNA glutamyl-Q(34) synthetase GluQRS [Pigmentiphaga litoralis]NYE23507.1 glutamyl-Q tRNA(Asp) synthetase [Pigmentiphaga litoralis]NYE82879.1 glutamyl-Q tRNA(Asp) synthetase [Pigmentiphaga litoralis]